MASMTLFRRTAAAAASASSRTIAGSLARSRTAGISSLASRSAAASQRLASPSSSLSGTDARRHKSTAVAEEEEEEQDLSEIARKIEREHIDEIHLDNNTSDTIPDFTSDDSKAGTPSPWAVFDAWGAGEGIVEPMSEDEEMKLSKDSVRIPFNEDERATLPGETEILKAYDHLLKRKSSVHFGYPYNLMYNHEELYEFMKYSINNLGDPFITSNYGVHSRQFECSVIDFFADLWKMEENSYWGYVTTCGTEGNLHGILLARECHPDGILYSSKETHYSIFKAARYYRMDAKAIPTLPMGEIDYDILASEIEKNIDRPVIINVNIGTTVKGAVDNLDRILRILKTLGVPRERYHIHCDGALFAMMMPFVDFAPEVSFKKPIDSIAVSGHKMLGCPMPCGVALARKEHVKKVEQRIDYLNSVDTTIMGSRNGQAALYLWYSLRKKGIGGIKRDVVHCIETAQYLRNKLTEAGFTCRLNDLSCTVVLERPMDDKLVKRWQLACEEDIAHVVVMPNVTRQKIDKFVEELLQCNEEFGRMKPARPGSPLTKLASSAWGGSCVTPVGDFKSE
uniref:Histidine decarboxylase n=1 Tax=Odontella aurita TaxID=265563 RepID=A0A6U6DW62_9STRA|mmetsp:Transcript_22796/g.67336  ORF Transcript_22796/g.67336 Transcript_22796/m.67336 type:complete len:567 (+) Transcript_22796:93-1793(+)